MRTNIDIDSKKVKKALRLTGLRTKRELVDQALDLLIQWRDRKSLCDLTGKINFSPGFDYREIRNRD